MLNSIEATECANIPQPLTTRITREIRMAENENITPIEQFAEKYRVRIKRDECNDQIIEGRRGHLYFDGDVLCFMALDRKPANQSTWETLGGKIWMGSISPDSKGKRVQDVKITGVTNPKAAFRMAGIFPIRQLSEEHKAKIAKTTFKPRNASEASR